jgi:predicted transcriptional regulator
MPPSPKTSASNSGRSKLSYEDLALLLCHPTRWRILEVLAEGEPMMVKELARRVGKAPHLVQKVLASMREIGVVIVWQGRLNHLAPEFRPQPGTKDIDLGHCVLRFGDSTPGR